MALLEVNNLRLVYPNGHEAIKSVSFAAEAGEIVAIIGRSGAGKSTLLRCINGLERATENKGLQNNKLPIHDKPGKRIAPELIMHSMRRVSCVLQQISDRRRTIESTAGGR